MRKVLALAAGVLALTSLASALTGQLAWSQAGRTIRIILTVPPGGSIDLLARLLAEHVSSTKGPAVIVESRQGGGGVIAAEAVARATPDGNTLLINNNGIIISSILRKVNYDPQTSFEPWSTADRLTGRLRSWSMRHVPSPANCQSRPLGPTRPSTSASNGSSGWPRPI
jgi:tripartite-type tricarboxylate transporter receptor subunit TctC